MQVDSMFDEFGGRTVIDLGCGTVRPLRIQGLSSLPEASF